MDGENRIVYVYLLAEEGRYPPAPKVYDKGVFIPGAVLEGLKIEAGNIFRE